MIVKNYVAGIAFIVYRFFDPELGCNLSLGQVP